MIALAQNDPGDILAGLGARGLQGRVLERRRADEEFLCVLKMWRAGEPEYGEEAGAEAGADVGGGEAGGAGGGGGRGAGTAPAGAGAPRPGLPGGTLRRRGPPPGGLQARRPRLH